MIIKSKNKGSGAQQRGTSKNNVHVDRDRNSNLTNQNYKKLSTLRERQLIGNTNARRE